MTACIGALGRCAGPLLGHDRRSLVAGRARGRFPTTPAAAATRRASKGVQLNYGTPAAAAAAAAPTTAAAAACTWASPAYPRQARHRHRGNGGVACRASTPRRPDPAPPAAEAEEFEAGPYTSPLFGST